MPLGATRGVRGGQTLWKSPRPTRANVAWRFNGQNAGNGSDSVPHPVPSRRHATKWPGAVESAKSTMGHTVHDTVGVLHRHPQDARALHPGVFQQRWSSAVPTDTIAGPQRQYCRPRMAISGGTQGFKYSGLPMTDGARWGSNLLSRYSARSASGERWSHVQCWMVSSSVVYFLIRVLIRTQLELMADTPPCRTS